MAAQFYLMIVVFVGRSRDVGGPVLGRVDCVPRAEGGRGVEAGHRGQIRPGSQGPAQQVARRVRGREGGIRTSLLFISIIC